MRCEYIAGSGAGVSTLNLQKTQKFTFANKKIPHKEHKPFAKGAVLCYSIDLYGYDSDP